GRRIGPSSRSSGPPPHSPRCPVSGQKYVQKLDTGGEAERVTLAFSRERAPAWLSGCGASRRRVLLERTHPGRVRGRPARATTFHSTAHPRELEPRARPGNAPLEVSRPRLLARGKLGGRRDDAGLMQDR